MATEDEKLGSACPGTSEDTHGDARDRDKSDRIPLPSHVAGSGTLDQLVETARVQAEGNGSFAAFTRDDRALPRQFGGTHGKGPCPLSLDHRAPSFWS